MLPKRTLPCPKITFMYQATKIVLLVILTLVGSFANAQEMRTFKSQVHRFAADVPTDWRVDIEGERRIVLHSPAGPEGAFGCTLDITADEQGESAMPGYYGSRAHVNWAVNVTANSHQFSSSTALQDEEVRLAGERAHVAVLFGYSDFWESDYAIYMVGAERSGTLYTVLYECVAPSYNTFLPALSATLDSFRFTR